MNGPFSFQYFGSPIGCKANGKPVSASFLDHCWMHGTSLIIDKPDLEENARCLLKDNELKEVRTQINAIKSIIKLVFLPLKSQSIYVVYKKL